MRLIDADKVDFNEVFIGNSDFARDTREAAKSLIDMQPTALDVNAVLERCCQYEEIGLTPEEVKELVTGLRSMKAVVLTGTDAEEWIAYQDGKH